MVLNWHFVLAVPVTKNTISHRSTQMAHRWKACRFRNLNTSTRLLKKLFLFCEDLEFEIKF